VLRRLPVERRSRTPTGLTKRIDPAGSDTQRDHHACDAVAPIASYQGIALLTNTFREPDLMVRESRRLEHWIDSLA
jgi:hypothetical protein